MNDSDKIKLVTHDGSFHADDIFACAALTLLLEKDGREVKVMRTRDEAIIKSGDYVFDVGGKHEPEKNRFDHHQIGGAGRRPASETGPGIEYAAFGLVWKKIGVELSGSQKVADIIDKRIVAPVDAWDNGFDLVENKHDITPYYLQHSFLAMRPTWREDISKYDMFIECVNFAKRILEREIIQATDTLLAEDAVINIYNETEDKRIIILDQNYPSEYILNDYPEPLFVVYPRDDGLWAVKTVKADPKTFINRKNFPKLWAGLKDEDLQNVTGIYDAVFCHRGLFLAVAKSREGAIKLAQIAVES